MRYQKLQVLGKSTNRCNTNALILPWIVIELKANRNPQKYINSSSIPTMDFEITKIIPILEHSMINTNCK